MKTPTQPTAASGHTQHAGTAGPWYVSRCTHDNAIVDETNGTTIAVVYGRNAGSEANAQLIAAAPDLLAALTELVREADTQGGSIRTVRRVTVDQARSAIAQATKGAK